MEVSTSYCKPTVSYKYGSYHETDDSTSMMEEDMCHIGSYNSFSNSQAYDYDGYMYDEGSVGEYDEDSSCCENDNIFDQQMGNHCEASGLEEEMLTESDMTEDLDDDDNDLDDADNDEWTNEKRHEQKNSVAYYAAMEMLRIRFPFQSISIRISDFCCLQEKDLLNDTMIDFYLNHIVEHVLPDNISRNVTVLPSVFWHNLSLRQHALDIEEEKSMTEEQKLDHKFSDLHDFVKDFDLQDFDFIVVPVNEWEHWSLAIICNPFSVNSKIIIFDSQLTADYNNLQNMASLIEEFMQYSWLKRTGNTMPYPLKCVIPKNLPQQSNNFDCGVFIVEFARCFLMNPPKNLDSFDFQTEFGDFSIFGKRTEMQRTVLSLCSNRSQWRPLVDLLNGINTAAPHRAL